MAEHYGGYAPAVWQAVQASYLASFPADILQDLIADAVRLDLPAGSTIYREAEPARLGLVVAGLFRVFMTAPAGRQVTVRYAHPGAVLGTPALVGGPVPVGVQAVVDSTFMLLNVRRLRALAQQDVRLAWPMAEEISRRLNETLIELAGNTFGTIRQRVARHLLDLAASQQQGQALLAPISQQELADAVGTVREVIVRIVRDLRSLGVIETRSDGIAVLDPVRLYAATWAGEGGTIVTPSPDAGS